MPFSGFNTQPPEGGWPSKNRPSAIIYSFNTQPPEGGWSLFQWLHIRRKCFNTQPPEGGWLVDLTADFKFDIVSTHSRLKAAGYLTVGIDVIGAVSTHSRLKAAGNSIYNNRQWFDSFNTQPPEGGWAIAPFSNSIKTSVSTHSRLKAAGSSMYSLAAPSFGFQHTAA